MKRDPGPWLLSPPVSLRWIFLAVSIWVSGLMLFQYSRLSQESESRIEAPLLFNIRNYFGMSPTLDPKLKVFGFDDTTLAVLKRPRLNYLEWAELLERIDQRQPKAIIIDALFSVTESVHDDLDTGREQMVRRLQALHSPVIVGAYAVKNAIPGRVPLASNESFLDISSYVDTQSGQGLTTQEQASQLPLADFRGSIAYGPEPSVRGAFKRIGHILYGQREGRFYPFLRLSDEKALPYLMLRPFDDLAFRQGRMFIGGGEIPLSDDGSAMINYSSKREYASRVNSMRTLMQDKQRENALEGIKAGDYVYLIPMHFTGNTDFKPSPMGLMPGAYMHLAVLNSILQKSFLQPIDAAPLLIVVFGLLGALLAWWLSPAALCLALLCMAGLWSLVWIGAFVMLGWVLPWVAPSISLLGVGLSLLLHRTREAERKAQFIRHSLEGSVQEDVLHVLQEHPERLQLEARERIVSIMFVDIVGFSLMVENQLPRLAFESLRELIESISSIIHEHGGVVNKTLGDGLLCFFGYSFEEDRERADHAEKALLAATKIQRSNVPRMIRAARNRDPVFPLRIGINTAAVFMGNLGSGVRLDFTVVGNGVNFAKRLEGACMAHSILVGPTTKELVEPVGPLARAKRRMIAIKHHSEMVEAWEYDPFTDQSELRSQAEQAYRSTTYTTRIDRRWTVAQAGNIRLDSPSGKADVLNFSSTGMSITLATLLPRGTRFEVELDSENGGLAQALSALGMKKIAIEVRWVQNHEEQYLHGVRYLELDHRQTELVTDLLCQFGLDDAKDHVSEEAS